MERLLNLIPKKYHKRIFTCNNRLMQEYKLAGTLFTLDSNPPMGNEKGKIVGYASNLQHLKELRKTYVSVLWAAPSTRVQSSMRLARR